MQLATRAETTELTVDDCWNRIGVRGDGSCSELETHLHCRNCPTYSAAATRLLDRELPPGHLESWTSHFAAATVVETPGTLSAFLFRIGAEWLAMPAGVVVEVAEPRPIHEIPHRSGIVLGLANVRGELLVCISLGQLMGIAYDAPTRAGEPQIVGRQLLVLRSEGRRVVCPVDEIHGGLRHAESDLSMRPGTVAGAVYTRAVLRWGGRTAGYLDERLVAQALERGLA